jgi:GntR family transcriptional repressor for pyruvate dehydrogenase complex
MPISGCRPEVSDVRQDDHPTGLVDRRPTSHQLVAEVLRRRIALGDFPPGSRLPTERELSEVLGVGRNTVRQALRQLTEEGLVSTTLGRSGGTRVRAAAEAAHTPRAEIIASFRATIRDCLEYRQAIEPFAARLAAERAPTEVRRQLLRLLDEPAQDLSSYHRLDSAFHLGLAAASGNPMLHRAIEAARAEMFVGGNALWLQAGWSLGHAEGVSAGPRLREEHLAIALAVLAGDGPAAEARMREHLDHSRQQFRFLIDQLERLTGDRPVGPADG